MDRCLLPGVLIAAKISRELRLRSRELRLACEAASLPGVIKLGLLVRV